MSRYLRRWKDAHCKQRGNQQEAGTRRRWSIFQSAQLITITSETVEGQQIKSLQVEKQFASSCLRGRWNIQTGRGRLFSFRQAADWKCDRDFYDYEPRPYEGLRRRMNLLAQQSWQVHHRIMLARGSFEDSDESIKRTRVLFTNHSGISLLLISSPRYQMKAFASDDESSNCCWSCSTQCAATTSPEVVAIEAIDSICHQQAISVQLIDVAFDWLKQTPTSSWRLALRCIMYEVSKDKRLSTKSSWFKCHHQEYNFGVKAANLLLNKLNLDRWNRISLWPPLGCEVDSNHNWLSRVAVSQLGAAV